LQTDAFGLFQYKYLQEKKMLKIAKICAIGLLLQGCASIVSGSTQSLSVEAKSAEGAPVVGASCKMTNDKGTWFTSTPGSIALHRSADDLTVTCSKDLFAPGTSVVKLETKGMAAGNILFGGLIGVGIDVATGAAFDYPTLITVPMTSTPLGAAVAELAK
jgi:hypothetical protein